jgi:hypothetical protein
MARTNRQRKLEARRLREVEHEIARRAEAGEKPVVVLIERDTKVRASIPVLAKQVDPDSDYEKRLAKARARLGLPTDLADPGTVCWASVSGKTLKTEAGSGRSRRVIGGLSVSTARSRSAVRCGLSGPSEQGGMR